MAYKLSIPFFGFKIKLHSGQEISFPLSDKDAFRIVRTKKKLAETYEKAIQKKILDKGEFVELMSVIHQGDFTKDTVAIAFPASKDKISYPAFLAEFDYFYTHQERGVWGIIPTLGLEAFAVDEEELEERLQGALQFEFTQQRRLAHVQRIVAAIWFGETTLIQDQLKLKAPTLKEVDEIIEEKPDQLLPQVAKKVELGKQEAYEREQEIQQLSTILSSKFQRNALIVGPSGVGKTALIWEIARRKKQLKIRGDIWETTASTLIKELTKDTGWQDNIEFLCQELTKSNDFLYVRNLMELFEVGKYEGNSVSVAEYLKPFISRGEVNIISECTEEEKAQIELLAPNYISNFQVITLEEPTAKLEEIITKKVGTLAKVQKVKFDVGAISEALRLNRRFSPYAGMPGKPIRFLESILLNKQKGEAKKRTITQREVIRHFCEDTGIPDFIVDPAIEMNVEQIKADFKQQLFGQEQAIEKLTNILAQVKTALSRTGQPIASFLFVGPTGVGKTELAKLLAKFMFNSRERVVRFDMSEFSTPYDIIRLSGIGSQRDGLLTAAILREPFSVILFDEIEKAHPNFNDLLLQILDEGRLSDSRGRLVNFCSSIIIMTSNIGATDFQRGKISWNKDQSNMDVEHLFVTAIEKHFKPELVNRIDEVIPFLPLQKEHVKKVVEKEIKSLREREGIKYRDVKLEINDNIYDLLVQKGYNAKYGARQMQRTIRDELLIPLAKELNQNVFDEQLLVHVFAEQDAISITTKLNPLGFDLLIEELELHTNTNHIGVLRRHCRLLKEGHYYNRLMSDLDILNQQLEKDESIFWSDAKNTLKMKDLTAIKERVNNQVTSIEVIEVNLGLSCMKLRKYTEQDKISIDQWEKDYLNLKQDIYSIGNPGNDSIHLTLYATNVDLFFQFYLSILDQKQYEFEAKGIWYTEQLSEILSEAKNEEIQTNRKGKRGYFKSKLTEKEYKSINPKEDSALLYGLELKIKGKCSALFFEHEEGFQQWKHNEDKSDFAHVSISKEPLDVPTNIHRIDYFSKQTMRRVIDLPVVRDPIYKINRESRKQELVDLFMYHINLNFEKTLEQVMV